jgi:hypothetical protein
MSWLEGILVAGAIVALYGVATVLDVADKVTQGTASEMIYTACRSVRP